MAREYEGQIRFVGLGGLDSAEQMEAFVDTHDLRHFPHAITEDGGLWVRFDISYQPAWVLLDAEGEVVLRGTRPSMDQVVSALEDLAG